jgi:metallophosphoesterase (TIGR00282 family)
MKIIYLGDIVGRAGRDVVLKHVPALREKYALDFVVASSDNAAGGFGVTPEIAKEFFAAGVDVLTGGDHVWDQYRDILPYLAKEKRMLRPHNFPSAAPGTGCTLFEIKDGRKILVLHLLGQVFHRENLDCPFACAKEALEPYRLGGNVQAILVDLHAEATSEKTAMGHFLDGKVSLVVGSHTHIPTADARILKGGTAYLTDAGMCGDYDSVIGFDPAGPLERFLTKIHKVRMEPGSGEGTLCGVLVETDDTTGRAISVQAVREGKTW